MVQHLYLSVSNFLHSDFQGLLHRMRIRVSEDFIEDKFGNSLRNMVRAENRIMHAGVGMFDVSMIVVRMQ